MSTTTLKKLSFEQFLEQYPDGYGIYELVNGEIVKVEPIRAHKNVARYLVRLFDKEIERLELDYIVDKDIVIRTVTKDGQEQGRIPDVSVVTASLWNSTPLTYGALIEPPLLAVEVTSPNWEDDYVDKLDEYQCLGIPEYWIVDYWAMGDEPPPWANASRAYLGYPKVPTVLVYQLMNGQYQPQTFTGSEPIISPTFPELKLSVEQIITASQIRKI